MRERCRATRVTTTGTCVLCRYHAPAAVYYRRPWTHTKLRRFHSGAPDGVRVNERGSCGEEADGAVEMQRRWQEAGSRAAIFDAEPLGA